MRAPKADEGPFQKVGPCLYRYKTGTYYGRFKSGGKEVRCSLETTDRKQAERNLADKKKEQSQIDPAQGKFTLSELCDKYLKTIQHQKPRTVEKKEAVVERIKEHWPTGGSVQVGKIKPSECDIWLTKVSRIARSFTVTSRESHISCLKEVFALAVLDRIIAVSPASHLLAGKRDEPIRKTPSFEQFQAIIADVRAQKFNADAQDSADFLEFMGLAGLGQAETAPLSRADIDFDRGEINTFRHKTAQGFTIPIYPQVRPLLERLCDGLRHSDRVFKVRDAKKALRGACERLKIPQFTQRSLRRVFVTAALQRGVDVKTIAQWQAHKDGGKLILNTYSHLFDDHSQRMAKLMTAEKASSVAQLPNDAA